jgi:hypothetical protein
MKLFKRKSNDSEDLRTCPFCGNGARIKLYIDCSRLVCRVFCTKGCTYRSRSFCREDFMKKDIDELIRLTIEDWNKRGE